VKTIARPHLLSPREENELKHLLIDALHFEECRTPQCVAAYLNFKNNYPRFELRHVNYYMRKFGLSWNHPHRFADTPEHQAFIEKLNEPPKDGCIDVENVDIEEFTRDPKKYMAEHPELFNIGAQK